MYSIMYSSLNLQACGGKELIMNWKNVWSGEKEKKYPAAKSKSTGQRAGLYYLAALYIGYMGYTILANRIAGDNTMPYPLAVALAAVLLCGAVFVAGYATKRMRNEWKRIKAEASESDRN